MLMPIGVATHVRTCSRMATADASSCSIQVARRATRDVEFVPVFLPPVDWRPMPWNALPIVESGKRLRLMKQLWNRCWPAAYFLPSRAARPTRYRSRPTRTATASTCGLSCLSGHGGLTSTLKSAEIVAGGCQVIWQRSSSRCGQSRGGEWIEPRRHPRLDWLEPDRAICYHTTPIKHHNQPTPSRPEDSPPSVPSPSGTPVPSIKGLAINGRSSTMSSLRAPQA